MKIIKVIFKIVAWIIILTLYALSIGCLGVWLTHDDTVTHAWLYLVGSLPITVPAWYYWTKLFNGFLKQKD